MMDADIDVELKNIYVYLQPDDLIRRLLADRHVSAEIGTQSPDVLAGKLSNIPEEDILASVSNAISEANVDGVEVASISDPVVISLQESPPAIPDIYVETKADND